MVVYELASMGYLNPKLKVRAIHTSSDEIRWEGYVSDLAEKRGDTFFGASALIDFVTPVGATGDLDIYFHFMDEWPQPRITPMGAKRIWPDWNKWYLGVLLNNKES